MLKDLLQKKHLQFILFGGKGGVGKTTMAAASAVALAKKYPKKKILLFTTDPAPSLSDSFMQPLSHEPVAVQGFTNLWAMEVDAKKELKAFKKKYGDDILNILDQGTYLSDEENEEMFNLDIPGLDEVMGLKKITDFMNSSEFDLFLLDTAPTGHTLRLLTLPEVLDDWIKFLASLRWKYHEMVARFAKEERREKADEFLLEMKKTVKHVQELLKDKEKTAFVCVTIPEAMGVLETKDLIADLKKNAIPNSNIIINNVVPDSSDPFMQSRKAVQDKYLKEIQKSFPDHTITEIPMQEKEVRGVEVLEEIGEALIHNS
jgi:arsenite/tail-anchored protein-transporting ATPase